jgi:predicted amidohydrolase
MTSRADKAANLATAERLVARAAAQGADVVVLPEKWNGIGTAEEYRALAEPLAGGESLAAMSGWARQHGIVLVGGSITELPADGGKLPNTCCVFDRDGLQIATYRKIHLFDVDAGGTVYRESDSDAAGDEVVVAEADGLRIGLSICYDLRFPELYRLLALAGARLLTVPANFAPHTGKDHWEPLLRARAIENQCWVAAPAQTGLVFADKPPAYGRSLIVDPWGVVVATAGDEETVIVAELDMARQDAIRERLPALRHRRPDAYRPPAAPAPAPSA